MSAHASSAAHLRIQESFVICVDSGQMMKHSDSGTSIWSAGKINTSLKNALATLKAQLIQIRRTRVIDGFRRKIEKLKLVWQERCAAYGSPRRTEQWVPSLSRCSGGSSDQPIRW